MFLCAHQLFANFVSLLFGAGQEVYSEIIGAFFGWTAEGQPYEREILRLSGEITWLVGRMLEFPHWLLLF